jgi:hypothetical protein
MNLDELREAWRSQDASPLHGINEAHLRLVLQQEVAKLQAQRRVNRRIIYVYSAGLFAGMAIFLVMIFGMLFYTDDDVIVGWDVVTPIVGAAAALFMAVQLYVARRAEVQREQRFGESLRDQLGLRIAQLDYEATTALRRARALVIALFVGATAIVFASIRVNLEPNEPFDRWGPFLRIILFFALALVAVVWAGRRAIKRHVLPRKRELEALLKELDA